MSVQDKAETDLGLDLNTALDPTLSRELNSRVEMRVQSLDIKGFFLFKYSSGNIGHQKEVAPKAQSLIVEEKTKVFNSQSITAGVPLQYINGTT